MENKEIEKKESNGQWNKILLKKTNVDNEVGFDFHLSPLKWVGIVFAISAVFLPFSLDIIFRIAFNENDCKELRLDLIKLCVKSVLALVGMIYIIKKLTLQKFLKSAVVGFYLFHFFMIVLQLISLILITTITYDPQIVVLFVCMVQATTHLTAIILIFVLSPTLRLRFKKTFKENFLLIMVVVVIGSVVMIGLNFLSAKIDKLFSVKELSQNQWHIIAMKNTKTGIILMFFLTVITAPFIEELACRHAIFSLSGNKWLAFFTSVIYFAFIHVAQSGDWIRILPYMVCSIVLTLTFLYVRGNVTYVIFIHMINNMFAFILILI